MKSAAPTVFDDSDDPRLKLTVENRIRNVFVTQLGGTRHKEDENVNHIPVVTESRSRLLRAGVNTLQRTLVLEKRAEMEEVDKQLALKRQEYKNHVQVMAQRRAELQEKQQQTEDMARKFEKFVSDNEIKRRRALKKYQDVQEQNALKQKELKDLTTHLKRLQDRQQIIKERVRKYKIYEEYLVKTLQYLPKSYLEYGSDSLVMPIIRRHETLSITHRELLQSLGHLEEKLENDQQHLQTLKQEHSIKQLMANQDLSELQSEWERLKEKNKQTEMNLLVERDHARDEAEEAGSMLMAIQNLAEQCYLPEYGPLENMNILTKMGMVKEYILDKADTDKRAKRLMDCASTVTSGTAIVDKREWGSLKSITSRTQLKSSSKASRKS
ncbi:uncharacterized protein CCDC197 [Genypterus blacodes]|uniref:uncharacterized protein CCDC197 n=1 Tax=Genypterus blacodes TaxID=154954 RepID=UPI003F761EAC